MDKYNAIITSVHDAGYHVTPVEQMENWDRIVLASKRRDGGGYTGNSFWVTLLANTWILGTWADMLYKFPNSNALKSFCVQTLSERPDEVLTEIGKEIGERLGVTEISDDEFDALINSSGVG